MTVAEGIYLLCATTSLVVAAILLRQYLKVRTRLVLWSVVCFAGLAVNNVMVYIDLVMYTGVDLSVYRSVAGAVAMVAMVYGLVWEAQK
jgi:hypothetical protein